jgi:hypothetical protein
MDVKPRGGTKGAKNSFREVHHFLAELLGVPELDMTDEKAARFASAWGEFRRHFAFADVVIDPKWLALSTMVYVAYDTYAPAAKAVAARRRGEVPQVATGLPAGAPAAAPAPAAAAAPVYNVPATHEWFAPGNA